MGYICGGRRVGRRAHTGFVGVKAALDTPHHAGACKAAEYCLEVKRRGEYVLEHQGQSRYVHDDDDKGYDYVQKSHCRNENAGDVRKALAAAEDADREQNGKDSADDDRGRGLIVEAEGLEGILGVEGCQHIVADNIGQDEDNGKDNAQPALLERVLYVV